jgi:hypothetical protein
MMMEENSLPRTQLRYLIRHFFGRFFDSEVIATPYIEAHILFVQILGLLVFPGFFKTVLSVTKYSALAWYAVTYRDQAVLIDTHFFLCLSMILIGFITVFELDALFPDQKDFYNLTPLPIKPQQIFYAKVIVLLLFVVFCHIAINGIPTLFFPGEVLAASWKPGSAGWNTPPSYFVKYTYGHIISLFLSSLFVFTTFIAVRAVFLLIFPTRLVRMVSRYTQLFLILILLCAFISNTRANALIVQENALIYLLPPFWFLGVYEVLIGHQDPVFGTLAKMAYTAVAISGFVSILSYALSYRSSMQKGFQSAGSASCSVGGLRKIWIRILHKALLKGPMERASFHFIAQTLFRRQEHMLYWGSFIMIGIAFIHADFIAIKSVITSGEVQQLSVLLSFPLIASFFILIGLRFSFSVPADLNANWIFKIIEKHRLETAYGGVHKFMLCAFFIPMLTLFVPFYLVIWDPLLVLLHTAYVSMLSLILIEMLLFQFEKLPFTCSYLPGKANLKLWWPVYVLACILYTYGMTELELWLLQDMRKFGFFIFLAGVVFFALYRHRSLFLKELNAIQFEEIPQDQAIMLSIEG